MNTRIGIVGNAADKFTPLGEQRAKERIKEIITQSVHPFGVPVIVSGHCHLGGVDIWAEEAADRLGLPKDIKPPATLSWSIGYKPRNLAIARDSDEVHVIVAKDYPQGYTGQRFALCYHCKRSDHVKSGGCWTAIEAAKQGKRVMWHFIDNN